MIIWQRWGILVFFAAAAGLAFSLTVIKNLLPAEPAYAQASFAVSIGLFIGAVLALGIWLLRYFQLIDRPYAGVDPSAKRKRPPSTLFFLPIVAWPIVLAALGIVALVIGLN